MSGMEPYQPPKAVPARRDRPGVITWYNVYCAGMAVIYLLLLVAGVGLFVAAPSIDGEDMSTDEARMVGVMLGLVSLPLAVFFGAAPMLPRREFAWIYGIVAIAIGLTSACCIPVLIPLLIFWIKPEARAYFQEGP